MWRFVGLAAFVHVTLNAVFGLYGPVWQHASILEAKRMMLAGASATALLFPLVLIGPRLVPLSVALSGSLAAVALMGVLRFQPRLFALTVVTGAR